MFTLLLVLLVPECWVSCCVAVVVLFGCYSWSSVGFYLRYVLLLVICVLYLSRSSFLVQGVLLCELSHCLCGLYVLFAVWFLGRYNIIVGVVIVVFLCCHNWVQLG